MRKLLAFDHTDSFVCEIYPEDVMELTLREVVNGEHSLTITTFQVLEKGWRILEQDKTGKWREFVVIGVDEAHESGDRLIGTYYCVWSLQHDLSCTLVSVMPGTLNPVATSVALRALLSTTSRWNIGNVTNVNTGGASMYDTNAWSALATLVRVWGGEIDATIDVGLSSGVVAREVDCYAQQGQQKATRRFDFGEDAEGVRRKYADEPFYCRISPRGKGEQTESGYGRKITIESVNDGKDYLEYTPMVNVCKLPDGNGGYEYPTIIVENSDMETPQDLKDWAEGILEQSCTPDITYEINVAQFSTAGSDQFGVALGDVVNVVDRKFGDGLRLSGRVVKLVVNEIAERVESITIGSLSNTLTMTVMKMEKDLTDTKETVEEIEGTLTAADYISNLLDRINAEINATGGYTYITEGQGLRTYDTAVSDPLVGSEASQVVEIKGGSIRIANSRTSGGDWDWKSVFTSGYISANLVTAARLTAGRIQSANGRSYWDLDLNQLVTYNINAYGSLETEDNTSKTYIGAGGVSFQYREDTSSSWEDTGAIFSTKTTDGSSTSNGFMMRSPYSPLTGLDRTRAAITCNPFVIMLAYANTSSTLSAYWPSIQLVSDKASSNRNHIQMRAQQISMWSTDNVYLEGSLLVTRTLTVNGTKNRKVATDGYGDRLLYCYETPSPMFGDIGSGRIGEDGTCYVAIDDVFSETARMDINYQVFLQKRGEGDAWVDAKEPTHFVVCGTPGLAFDWEVKALQTGYHDLRLENSSLDETMREELSYDGRVESAYEEELEYVETIERILNEAA